MTKPNSDIIRYKTLAGGSAETTVKAKLQENVSVLDFYANGVSGVRVDPTGVVDSTLGIQAALNSSNRVYFPTGSYLVTSVNLKANQTVYGDGASSVIIQSPSAAATATTNGVFYADSGSTSAFLDGINIRDLSFVGQVSTLGFFEFLHLVSLNGVSNSTVERCKLTGFRGDGVYIGCSAIGGVQRHNKNVHVNNCVLDGVNNDNRQGISVLDGDGIFISNNKFVNCTRPNMPGAIDFEPDGGEAWHVLRNCHVTNNHFDNCGGNLASIGFLLSTSASWTVKPECFIVANNTQVNPVTSTPTSFVSILFGTDGADTISNISITGNTAHSNMPFYLAQVNGVTIANNVFNYSITGYIGFNDIDTQSNVTVTGNVFVGNNSSYGVVVRGQISEVIVSGNAFSHFLDGAILVSSAGSLVKSLSIVNNTFKNITGIGLSVYDASGGANIEGSSCVYLGNIYSGTHTFPAWRTDDTGIIAQSFNSATLPDAFPYGVCVTAINGDVGTPNTGGHQGILTNYAQTSLATNYRYQTYNIANNTLAVGTTYIRRRNQSSNTWTAWYTITGV